MLAILFLFPFFNRNNPIYEKATQHMEEKERRKQKQKQTKRSKKKKILLLFSLAYR